MTKPHALCTLITALLLASQGGQAAGAAPRAASHSTVAQVPPLPAVESWPVPPFTLEPNINSGTYSFDQGSWRYNIFYDNLPGSNIGLNLIDYQANFIPEQERLEEAEVASIKTTLHDNDVWLTYYGKLTIDIKVTSFTLNPGEDGVCVTPGQPYRWTAARSDHITVRAGRHGDGYCARRWNERVGGIKNTFDDYAGKLNFYVGGTLKLTFSDSTGTIVYDNIYLGQGHAAATNNWWFGGLNCNHSSAQTVTCQGRNAEGKKVSNDFHRGGNPVSVVGVNPPSK